MSWSTGADTSIIQITDTSAALKQIADMICVLQRAEENLKLLVKNGVEQQHELTLLRGAELLHSCTKATMHDAVTLPEVSYVPTWIV